MSSLFRLKPYLRPVLGLLAIGILLAIPLAALRTAPALVVKHLVDELLVSKDSSKLYFFPAIFIGIYVINFFVRFLHYYSLRLAVARVNQQIKVDLFSHLIGLSADYYTAQSTGTLISRSSVDPQTIDQGINSISTLVREPITFLMLFCYALHLNWRLTLITLLLLPPLSVVFAATGRNLKRYITRSSEENARIFSILQESFAGIRVIKLFGLEKHLRSRFEAQTERFTKSLMKTAALEEASHPLVELVTAFPIAAVLYYGGSQILDGRMTPGDLLAFFTAFAMMLHPLRLMNDVSIKLNTAAAAATRVFEVFDWKSRIQQKPNPEPLHEFQRSIDFHDVGFAYPDAPEREILRGVSFSAPKGRTIALVGESGAGKSSIVTLIPRIFDVTSGSISIDGKDIRGLSIEDLRRQIAVVSQDVFLFNDTIEENIRLGRPDATPTEIREAARQAHATDFIEKLGGGFSSVIGDRGQKLSGGERQRLSIARAFLRKAPILILDEATSALDSASEKAVQEALNELMRNRTCIVIAHRLSTIRNADQILVLRSGKIVESGTHSELLDRGGEYAHYHALHSHSAEAPA